MTKTNKYYTCKDCKKELRKKEVTQELVDLNLCPQCYTNRIMKNQGRYFKNIHTGEIQKLLRIEKVPIGIGRITDVYVFEDNSRWNTEYMYHWIEIQKVGF